MADANPKRIDLQLTGRMDEGTAGSSVLPGTAINKAADGKFDECSVTAAIYLKGALCIAGKAKYEGKTIDQATALDEPLEIFYPLPGDVVYALVKDGETIADGDYLIPETVSGLFVEVAGTEARYSLQANEAVSPAGVNGFVRCTVQ